jgi:hypothetical protein
MKMTLKNFLKCLRDPMCTSIEWVTVLGCEITMKRDITTFMSKRIDKDWLKVTVHATPENPFIYNPNI